MAQTVLITGAGRRVGKAMALGLARHGHAVAVHYNSSQDAADNVVREIRASGGRAAAVAADLRDEAATADLIGRAADAIGPLTALINNASVFEKDEALTATRDGWDQHMQVNLRAPFLLIQHFARALPADREGAVINILDQRVLSLNPLFMSYTVSKAGLWTLTRTLAQALAPRIRVNAIGPGPTLPSIHQNAETFAQEAAAVPLGHGPALDEFVDAALFLLESRSVTGQMIALDGGQHLAWRTPDVDASGG